MPAHRLSTPRPTPPTAFPHQPKEDSDGFAVNIATVYAAPGEPGSLVELKDRYENFIGGEWLPPSAGKYRENLARHRRGVL